MRILLVSLLVLALPAAAQDGCTQADPCEWVVQLDAEGFAHNTVGGTYFNGTAGDWYRFDIYNGDEVPHTVTVEGYDLEWTVDSLAQTTTDAFELDTEGTFRVTDEPSGDHAELNVLLDDVVESEEDDEGSGAHDTPAPAAIGALLVGLLLRRR